jgi:anaerobic magnesium-protoporphyrin IX monomethyl ester cyclase
MKRKLLFIVPMHIGFESFLTPAHNSRSFKKRDGRSYNSLSTDMPLGALSMSAYIKQFVDVDVRLLDFNAEINVLDSFPYDTFYECCKDLLLKMDYVPDVVGVSSLFSPSFHNFMDCGRAVRDLFPQALVLGGGNIPTNSYDHIYRELRCDFYDGLCYGEGERPLLGVLQAEDPRAYMDSSRSWITPRKVVGDLAPFTPSHDFIENLDEIPFFDYDLCSLEKHATNPVTSSFHNVSYGRGFHIMTSRGCPYHCTFCASHRTHGREMRFHSVGRVKEDLTKLRYQYGATTVIFQDDHLMSDKNRVYELLKIVGDLKLESLYQNGLTLFSLDRPMLEAFYAAGVRHLVLPVESGSEKVLRHQMKKPLKLQFSERVAKDCRELGIYTNSNILIGMPGETKADIEEARRNLRRIPTNWFNIACASPIVGSDMHYLAMEKGYIRGDTLGSDYRKAIIETDDFSADYIQGMQYLMNLELNFVLNTDVRLGEYETALMGFRNVIRLKPDHAFAHYFAAQCYKGLNDLAHYEEHMAAYFASAGSPFWRKYVEHFRLPKKPGEVAGTYEPAEVSTAADESDPSGDAGHDRSSSLPILSVISN